MQAVRTAMRTYRRVCLVMPTGSGKTVTFSRISEMVWTKGMRVTLMAHRIEIVRQISMALTRERVRHGIIAPSYPETSAPVQVAMVQTLAGRMDRYPRPDLLVIDECHHAVAGSYMKIMSAWPDIFVLGVTATPARLDGKGLADAFDTMVFGPTMSELQARGYLCRYNYFAPPMVANIDSIKTRGGDYKAEDMARVMDDRTVTGDAIDHYRRLLNGKPAIAFCSTVEHAEHVAVAFQRAGWKAVSVDGSMDRTVRANLINGIGNGDLNVLTSCDIISEGTDIPVVQGAIMLRPTMSTIVYMQQAGRVLRPKADGSRATILDHVGNVLRHGLPDAPREWSLTSSPKRAQAASVRSCPKCYLAFAPAPRCPDCGHVFAAAAAPSRAPAKAVAGELQDVTGNYLAATPLKTLVKNARTEADLMKIAEARGFKPGWARIQMQFKRDAAQRWGRGTGWERHA